MITIRLLGGARKALGGKASISFENPHATVSDILRFLQENSTDAKLLNPANLIVAVNGVDSGAIKGQDSEVSSGDTVTIVTVVHGGSVEEYEGVFVFVIGAEEFQVDDVGTFIDEIRKNNSGVHIQVVNAESVFGLEHVRRVLSIVLESKKRGIMIASKFETELLLRLACTSQINEAIKRAGARYGSAVCFVAFSEDDVRLETFLDFITNRLPADESVLLPTPKKKARLARRLGIESETVGDRFVDHLVEQAAVLVR
jgi:tRNA threonylcarbamoyladenosine modification (KEOPS) complex Cgi121 subunit/molybdopterin converting factor small subunit